jgi:hypothetical protein
MSDEMSETKKIGLWLNVYQYEDGEMFSNVYLTEEACEFEANMTKHVSSMTVFAKAVPVDVEEGYNLDSEEGGVNE